MLFHFLACGLYRNVTLPYDVFCDFLSLNTPLRFILPCLRRHHFPCHNGALFDGSTVLIFLSWDVGLCSVIAVLCSAVWTPACMTPGPVCESRGLFPFLGECVQSSEDNENGFSKESYAHFMFSPEECMNSLIT